MGYKVISKKELCPNQYEIQLEAPYVVRNAQAGQFIIFRVEEEGERVPLTIADVDKGIEIKNQIHDLKLLILYYESGSIKENHTYKYVKVLNKK